MTLYKSISGKTYLGTHELKSYSKSRIITRCCVCKRIKVMGKWVSNIGSKDMKVEDFGNTYSDGYCDKCGEKQMKEIK